MSRSPRIGSCILTASLLTAIAVLSTGCPVSPIVRVSRDVGGGANRNLDLTSHFSDMTNDYFDDNGGQMGGRISAVANFSDQYVMFGTKVDGFGGHGESVCIAPQTAALNLTDVAVIRTEFLPSEPTPTIIDIVGALIPAPENLFLLVPGDTVQPQFRVLHEHQNLNDQFWSYMGAVSAEDCTGRQVNPNGRVTGGGTLIRRGAQGTTDLAQFGNQ